ncbi:MAG: RagB/SusD family nutrient uptake outer membrane protein [Gemmatimonadota bacterium]
MRTLNRVVTRTVARLALVAGVSGLASCSSILEVEPEAFSGTTNYYQSPEQFDRALIGGYSNLQVLYGAGANGPMWLLAEMRSDNTTYQQNQSDRGLVQNETVDDFMTTQDNTGIVVLWNNSYTAILQSNVILDRIEAATFTDQAAKDRVIAEAKWLRALHYFNLVRAFGDVPLRLTETQSYDGAFTKVRTPADSIYKVIIADLVAAIPKLPTRAALPIAQAGRATQGAAAMLLADIYMTRKEWQNAAATLQTVLGMGYTLSPNFDRLFDPTFKNGSESIYEVQYAEGVVNESSAFLFRFIPLTSGRNLTFGTVDNANIGGWNIPTKDMLRAFEPNDTRKNASIGYWVSALNRPETDVAIGDTVPYIKKTYHAYSIVGRTNDNMMLYRYGETLLNYAETLNELGRTSEAYSFINQVRVRAGLPALTAGLSQADFREAVYREQRVELAFENKRWFQLVRTGRAVDVMRAHGIDLKSYALGRRPSIAYNVTAQMLLYPLPVREITINGFAQNPGY